MQHHTSFVLRSITAAALVAGLGTSPAVWAQSGANASGQMAAPQVKGPVMDVQTVSMTGTVTAIDPAHRLVTIKGEDSAQATVFMGPDIRNFESLKVGDKIKARYTQAQALALKKGEKGKEQQIGELRTKVESDAARQAAAGGKPGFVAAEQRTMVANVFSIDRERGVLTLRGTDGVPVDIKVSDSNALKQIGVNDQVVIGYRQATALSVEPG